MRKLLPLVLFLCTSFFLQAQETFSVNGVADKREGCYAFTNATIIKDAQTTLTKATLVIRQGKITAVGNGITIPADAVVIDCADKYIYPSLIDVYGDYGIPVPQRAGGGFNFFGAAQLGSNQKGAYGWNQALKEEVDAYKIFVADDSKAKALRDIGFGAVLTHQKDGIARGTGAVVTLAGEKENLVILKDRAANFLSFNKGTSAQSYPSSLMGTIALLRQTYLDAQWYKSNPSAEGVNITLKAWNENQYLPQIIDPASSADVWMIMRADRIGDEFGTQYIIKATGKEYQRIKEVAATKAPLIVSLNYPMAQDVDDPNDARLVSLTDLKHWELAPTNPAAIEKAGISFCLTAADLKDNKSFWSNLRKAIEYGLSEKAALDALTKTPASLLGIGDKVGSLEAGKVANFLITSGPLFSEKTTILQNWVQGDKYAVKEDNWFNIAGTYTLTVSGDASNSYTMDVKNNTAASIIAKDTLPVKFSYDGKTVKFSFAPEKKSKNTIRFSGFNNNGVWNGTASDADGKNLLWTASLSSVAVAKTDSTKSKPVPSLGKITYPFVAFGNETVPVQETYLIKNATVWTSEKEGKLENTDVLVKAGKIVQIGKNLSDAAAKVIDGTGKHLTAGIIDEHSHIAVTSINEGGQSVTSEVRIGDNLDPEDINIYRQLSGGVTSSHILHGSANTIGGQTQLIKLRWGTDDEGLKFKGAAPFIKFALGENVKRTAALQGNSRFPDTRMGVEQVLMDAFTRAKDYEKKIKEAEENNKKKGVTPMVVRRDLELDALVEIMNKKRFITCHSYIASEITSTMRVAEKFGFNINTFTHILEGYKVADKMKAHGANASTFSDWWAYKLEVQDAIPYNAYIMNAVGLNVCINSDDAEMARRLNQEAGKSIKYGGMSEEDALKMVTINPAKALHVADKVGSIKVGKDADLVLWSDDPVSIYAKALYTMVDGTVYFDREKDAAMRKQVAAERTRIINKMTGEKKEGRPTMGAMPSYKFINTCGEDHGHKLGMLEITEDGE
ncbi:MAG: amidohydrolase family protein [Sphingobacteriales bacterium]|nr:amidohydrolase family protein [Sphingobacteriales bacterium]